MPLVSAGALRKRWRYVGVYSEDLMLCAARAAVGPFAQAFWAVWDRKGGRRWSRTRLGPAVGEVRLRGPEVRISAPEVRATLQLGEAEPIESICPSGGGWGWTRKRAGLRVTGEVVCEGQVWQVDGGGVDDESAGYHQRHTSWHWSAGVGEAADGRALGWNLVTGINDPPEGSERAVWVDGVPREPAPVAFDGLDGIGFAAGGALRFQAESERARDENLLVLRSRYRHLFGAFSGSLDGLDLAWGLGVMEEHEAVW